jgi:hypothetical protein
MGQMEMNAYLILEKNVFILVKVTQVREVAHGPLVLNALINYIYVVSL